MLHGNAHQRKSPPSATESAMPRHPKNPKHPEQPKKWNGQ
ncbi:hypothetical protein GZL_00846 [Streptomyces sp. 769]|nr:hypothetical protein GZL_00846 [Streptomyces sp. 769]